MSLLLGSHAVHAGPGAIVIEGSTTIGPVAKRIAREFMKDHIGTRVSVATGGSGEGIGALIRGEVDIANSSRFISQQERNLAMENGIYPVPFRIADDCIIPITHKKNKLKNISLKHMNRIYRGQITNWKELGGADKTIVVVSRSPGSGTFGIWRDIVMEQEDVAQGVIQKASSVDVVKAVSGTTGAIGYISLGHLSANIKPLRVGGVMGSLFSVRDGSYPLSRPLFMFTQGWPQEQTLEFINYVLNPDKGQSIVQKSGFIPVHTHN